MMARILNRRGSTLIQSLVAMAILLLATFIFVGGLTAIQSQTKTTMVLGSSHREVTEIIENIRTGVEFYQIDFSRGSKYQDALDVTKLPMAWDVGIQTEAAKCPDCAGRYGFVITPFEGYRGLYLVTVRLTHVNWGKDVFRDYQFTVTTK